MKNLTEIAKQYINSGLSILPVKNDKKSLIYKNILLSLTYKNI